jgi:hypothetical protein
MKLFVLNKEDFDSDFKSVESQKSIHKKAYNYLLQSLGNKNKKPDLIRFDYDLWFIEFKFNNVVNDVYFYSYKRW